MYYGAWDIKNLFFLLLQGQQPFESILPLILEHASIFLKCTVNEGWGELNNPYIGTWEVGLQSSNKEPMYGLVCPPRK